MCLGLTNVCPKFWLVIHACMHNKFVIIHAYMHNKVRHSCMYVDDFVFWMMIILVHKVFEQDDLGRHDFLLIKEVFEDDMVVLG